MYCLAESVQTFCNHLFGFGFNVIRNSECLECKMSANPLLKSMLLLETVFPDEPHFESNFEL